MALRRRASIGSIPLASTIESDVSRPQTQSSTLPRSRSMIRRASMCSPGDSDLSPPTSLRRTSVCPPSDGGQLPAGRRRSNDSVSTEQSRKAPPSRGSLQRRLSATGDLSGKRRGSSIGLNTVVQMKRLSHRAKTAEPRCREDFKACCLLSRDAGALRQLKENDQELQRITDVGWGLVEIAASYGNIEALEVLINKNGDVHNVTEDGHNALTAACRSGQKSTVAYLLQHVNLRKPSSTPTPALHWASMYGHIAIVELLVAENANVNEVDAIERTPVIWAVFHGHVNVVKLLIDSRATVDCAYCEQFCNVHNEIIEFFNIAERHQIGLMTATKANDIQGVRDALDSGARVDAKDDVGWTALMWSAVSESFDLVAFLVSSGANMEIVNDDGLTAKELARKQGNGWNDISEYLEKMARANANIVKAARLGNEDLVRTCIADNAYINSTDELCWTPIHWAASRGDANVIFLLVEAKASIDQPDRDKYTPLLICASFGHTDCIERISKLKPAANVNARTKRDECAIQLAARAGQIRTLIWLLDRHRQISSSSWKGLWKQNAGLRTDVAHALLSGAFQGHLDVIKALHERDFNLTIQSNWGWEPVTFALLLVCRYGYRNIVEFLLSLSPQNINDVDSAGRSPLYWAARNEHLEIVEMLIEHQANPRSTASDGFSVLHAAAMTGNQDLCLVLIASGADATARTAKDGITPAHCASDEGHEELANGLRGYITCGPSDGLKLFHAKLFAHNSFVKAKDLSHSASEELLIKKKENQLHKGRKSKEKTENSPRASKEKSSKEKSSKCEANGILAKSPYAKSPSKRKR